MSKIKRDILPDELLASPEDHMFQQMHDRVIGLLLADDHYYEEEYNKEALILYYLYNLVTLQDQVTSKRKTKVSF